MSDFHPLRIESVSKAESERVGSDFQKEKLLLARSQSWNLYHNIKANLLEGMTEKEALHLSLRISADCGAQKNWHKPFVRFGPGSVLTFREPLQADYRLQVNDPVTIDLGPAWFDDETKCFYEGDVGDTFVFGENAVAEKCASSARKIFEEVEQEWLDEKLSGASLYVRMEEKAQEHGYLFTREVAGHRIGDFPHHQYSKRSVASLEFVPQDLLWVLEIHIRHPQLEVGAFFEDVLGAPKVIRSK
jgi:hypothetical protein